jgi:hypothetical protein
MKKKTAGSILLLVFAMTAVVHAHHSIAGIYDGSKQVTMEGVVTQFQFINPHAFLIMEVKSSAGKPQVWRLEMDNRFELIQIGMSEESFKRGDRIIVKGSPAYSQPQSMYLRRLDRPADGFWYEQVGSTPRISTAER